jgi:hypothetical protein
VSCFENTCPCDVRPRSEDNGSVILWQDSGIFQFIQTIITKVSEDIVPVMHPSPITFTFLMLDNEYTRGSNLIGKGASDGFDKIGSLRIHNN